jgi:hypothetical protein
MEGLTKQQWEAKLADLGNELERMGITADIVILGSVPNILQGQPSRTTIDLDIWNPTSQFDRPKLAQAAINTGLTFDPKSTIEPTRPYLQVVNPGLVQLGTFEAKKIAAYGGLHLSQPPAENLIASKLCRAEQQDIADIAWLVSQYLPDRKIIEKIIKTFPRQQRETAAENLIYLDSLTATQPLARPKARRAEVKATHKMFASATPLKPKKKR